MPGVGKGPDEQHVDARRRRIPPRAPLRTCSLKAACPCRPARVRRPVRARARQRPRGAARTPRSSDAYRRVRARHLSRNTACSSQDLRLLPYGCDDSERIHGLAHVVRAHDAARRSARPSRRAATLPASRSPSPRPVSAPIMRLRDSPASTGRPSAASVGRSRKQLRDCVRATCQSQNRDRSRAAFARCPQRRRQRRAHAGIRALRRRTSS